MTSPIPIASGMRLTPPRLNPSGWQSYPVAWTATTNPTLGDGVLDGRYRWMDDKMIALWIRLRVGAGTNVGVGQYRFSLPVPAVQGGPDPTFDAVALHGGQLYRYVGWASALTTSPASVAMYRANVNNQEHLASWTHATPVALASGHTMSLFGFYVAAL